MNEQTICIILIISPHQFLDRNKLGVTQNLSCTNFKYLCFERFAVYEQMCVCSGPCMTLILTKGDTGEGVVDTIRDLVGPKDVEQAKETAPQR